MAISTRNSTTTALAANSEFCGLWDNVSGFISVFVSVDSSNSNNKLLLEHSMDTQIIDYVDEYNNVDSSFNSKVFLKSKFFRLRLINNDSTDQSFLVVTSKYYKNIS